MLLATAVLLWWNIIKTNTKSNPHNITKTRRTTIRNRHSMLAFLFCCRCVCLLCHVLKCLFIFLKFLFAIVMHLVCLSYFKLCDRFIYGVHLFYFGCICLLFYGPKTIIYGFAFPSCNVNSLSMLIILQTLWPIYRPSIFK